MIGTVAAAAEVWLRIQTAPLSAITRGGSGPPSLVLLHGYGSNAEDWLQFTATIKLPANQAILVLICSYVGALYGGSRTAILLNIPGTAANAASCADGYALAKQGQAIYRGGIMAKGVAACASCHSPNGAGMPAQYPRLAGQFADYTLAQLQAFRSGERASDPNQMMRAVAAKLSDPEMKAVAEYIAGLR